MCSLIFFLLFKYYLLVLYNLHVSFMYYILRKYHIIEPLYFHYNGSVGVSFLLQHCIALDNFLEGHSDYRAFGLLGFRTIGHSVYRAFGLLDIRTIGPSDYWADTV
jgi:hypothetical protein